MEHDILTEYLISQEVQENKYFACASDKILFDKMLSEINQKLGTDFKYLTEVDRYRIPGSGEVITKYISGIQSETIRSYLVDQIQMDRIPNCDQIIYELYLHFKASREYISEPGKPSPAHIHVRYDNALWRLKPRRLKAELLQLADNPRDAYYLPFTMRTLASWKMPKMKDILLDYLDGSTITYEAVNLPVDCEQYAPSLATIKHQLIFTALGGLKYYPSTEVLEIIQKYVRSSDSDISRSAQKSVDFINKRLK